MVLSSYIRQAIFCVVCICCPLFPLFPLVNHLWIRVWIPCFCDNLFESHFWEDRWTKMRGQTNKERSVFHTCFMAKFDVSCLVSHFSCNLVTFFVIAPRLFRCRKTRCTGWSFLTKFTLNYKGEKCKWSLIILLPGKKKCAEKVHLRNVLVL